MSRFLNVRELPDRVAAGGALEVQLAPFGEWKQTVEDGKGGKKELVQKFDRAACDAVVANFSRDLLVDLDHESVDGGSTRAYAWVTALRRDDGLGLVGKLKFTAAGAEAVNSREFRFVSVAWFCDDGGAPYELDSVALTNRPNLPVRPILNRKPVLDRQPPTHKEPNMDKLKKILGLAPEATAEQVESAVAAVKNRVGELEAAARDAEAERFAETNAAKADRTALKNAYLASPEAAKALVAGIAAPKTQQVLNAAAAKKPDAGAASKDALAALPPSKRAEYYAAHASEIDG